MSLEPLLHGTAGLWTSYLAVQLPMAAGLARGRASLGRYLASPLASAAIGLGVGTVLSLSHAWWQALGTAYGAALPLCAGVSLSAATGYLGGRLFATSSRGAPAHVRGSLVDEVSFSTSDRDRRRSRAGAVRLAGIEVPRVDEAKHFKLIGTTGTGKSTAIAELLDSALRRGDRAMIADPDGGYAQKFFSAARGDLILNPFDGRSRRWDLFGELDSSYDVEQLARSLIPDHAGPDRSWREYARTFLSAVTAQAKEAGVADIGELYRLLVIADTNELRTLLRGTPAQPFMEEHNARMFDSIRSVTAAAVGGLQHVAQQAAEPLSIRRWVSANDRGSLFLPYKAGQIAALKSVISAWMRLGIFEAMNRDVGPGSNDGRQRPLWFVVDELDALGQIDGLKDALARLRKFDARCVLGFQSIAQVSGTYGAAEAQTIVENCGNTLILRCSASEGGGTARFVSQLVGERETRRETISTSRRTLDWFGSTTRGEQSRVEAALLPSQIEQLPDLTGYLKHASRAEWRRVRLMPIPENGMECDRD